MHIENCLFFVCYLLCQVFRLPYLLIIPVLHHNLIWLLAFLRLKAATVSHSADITRYPAVFTTVSHCASFYIVCGLHSGNMLSEKNWNTVYSLNIGISEALSPPNPSSASNTVLSFFIYWKQKPHVWLYCFNFHPVWPLKTTIDNIPWNWQKK